MKVRVSEPYRYANTYRVRFSCGIFCATRTVQTVSGIEAGAKAFADGVRAYASPGLTPDHFV